MQSRNEVFQKLKPPCVAIGQAALGLHGTRGSVQSVTDGLETLARTLSTAVSKPNALDAKLAEYVFFPIAQVLKASQKVSIRCLELCLQCIAILIDQGWRKDMPSQLAAQIVILCTLLGQRKPNGLAFEESTNELQENAFWCLYHLFSVAGDNEETQRLLISEANFPQLGQTISVILEGIQDGGSVEAQISATSALDSLIENVADTEIKASFLPGIISKLTKVLTPQTKARRNHNVTGGCLSILVTLLRTTMNDHVLDKSVNSNGSNKSDKSIIDAAWIENAATQLKPALSNILRLKHHSRDDVKGVLARLCLMLLQECRSTLSNCARMALETLVTMSAASTGVAGHADLDILVNNDVSIARLLQEVLYDWLQGLTTIMQSSDEQVKATKLQQIGTAFALTAKSGLDNSIIERILANTLRDCTVVTLMEPAKQEASTSSLPIQSLDSSVLDHRNGSPDYKSPLVRYRGQEDVLDGIEKLARTINVSHSASSFAAEQMKSLRQSNGEAQVAAFWLALTTTQAMMERKSNDDNLLNMDLDQDTSQDSHLEELYSFSLSLLSSSSDEPVDPRMQALALRTMALRAKAAGPEFRYELVDALYPVLHTLATPNEHLQQDSITTLNIFTSTCGYASVKDLIVENVDYLTNAVALKLNAFDVSPQAPQVLLMMVRLAGPSLLPYLEDTVESIFAALEDYHGYPLLVELLFRVLGVMAEEGVKAPQLAISNGSSNERTSQSKDSWQPATVVGLAAILKERRQEEDDGSNSEEVPRSPAPQQPWKEVDKHEDGNEDDQEPPIDEDQQMDDADLPPPAPKTYNLLFKITELTQHFLPSASPSLRVSLLSLIRTTVPAIARHENSFLPLINTLWPEVVSRLDDSESHIIATALDILRILCEYAGDFMRTRIDQLWPRLVEIYQSTANEIIKSVWTDRSTIANAKQSELALASSTSNIKQAMSRMQAHPASYSDTSNQLLWTAITVTLTSIIQHVQISTEQFDEALGMLEPVLERDDVRFAIEQENADAFWLANLRIGAIAKPEMPIIASSTAIRFAGVPG